MILPPEAAQDDIPTASDHTGAVEEETLRELNQRKQELEFELRQYGETARKNKSGERAAGLVAPDTRIAIQYAPSAADGCVYLVLRSNNDARIKAAQHGQSGVLAGPWLASTGSSDCISRLGAALRTREKRPSTSDPSGRPLSS